MEDVGFGLGSNWVRSGTVDESFRAGSREGAGDALKCGGVCSCS